MTAFTRHKIPQGGITMKLSNIRVLGPTSAALIALAISSAAFAQSKPPIKFGVISEAQSVAGSSIPMAAQLAADEINAKGGVFAHDDRRLHIQAGNQKILGRVANELS